MKTLILTCKEDRELGGLGLIIPGMNPGVDVNPAQDGLLLAHDLVEHVNGVRAIGTIDDELEALGAIWFVRGQFNDLRRGNPSSWSVHENIASDIVRMFRDFFYGSYVDLKAPRTLACEADDEFKEIIACALRQTRGEVSDGEATEGEIAERERAYMAVCLPRMRIGYRKAKRKYGKATRANNLFWAIDEAVSPYIKNLDNFGEGAEYKLTFGFEADGNAVAHCEEFYGEDYE